MENNRPFFEKPRPHNVNLYVPATYSDLSSGLRPAADGRATKGKRPYGQARRLTLPDLIILCRIATWGRSLRYGIYLFLIKSR